MLKALAIKELRESAAILGMAALATLWLLGNLMDWRFTPLALYSSVGESIPFVNSGFTTLLILLGGAVAIALGLKQSAWENNGDKFYFLLHRPIARRTIVLVKVLFGLSCLLLFTVGPLLIYANWAATPGNHASPFFWGMTLGAWKTCCALPSMYLAAVLSGLRPARWLGTRLLPLAGAGILVVLSMVCWSELHWGLGLVCLIALNAVLLLLVLATAEQRDY